LIVLMIIGLFGVSLVLARSAQMLTELALRLFAYAPGHRAYTVTRMVTFAVLFTTMYSVLLHSLAGFLEDYQPPQAALHGPACGPTESASPPAGCMTVPSPPIR
jgi:hypothetical protein